MCSGPSFQHYFSFLQRLRALSEDGIAALGVSRDLGFSECSDNELLFISWRAAGQAEETHAKSSSSRCPREQNEMERSEGDKTIKGDRNLTWNGFSFSLGTSLAV